MDAVTGNDTWLADEDADMLRNAKKDCGAVVDDDDDDERDNDGPDATTVLLDRLAKPRRKRRLVEVVLVNGKAIVVCAVCRCAKFVETSARASSPRRP